MLASPVVLEIATEPIFWRTLGPIFQIFVLSSNLNFFQIQYTHGLSVLSISTIVYGRPLADLALLGVQPSRNFSRNKEP